MISGTWNVGSVVCVQLDYDRGKVLARALNREILSHLSRVRNKVISEFPAS